MEVVLDSAYSCSLSVFLKSTGNPAERSSSLVVDKIMDEVVDEMVGKVVDEVMGEVMGKVIGE